MAARRVAALYDIHGNLPALEAVLADVEAAGCDLIVVGGDVAAGPLPRETIDRVHELEGARFVMGNADREIVDAYDRPSGEPGVDAPRGGAFAWFAGEIGREGRDFLAGFEPTVGVEVAGLGRVLFCHGTPDSDEDVITRATPDERLARLVAAVDADVVVCGHTHQQFDRTTGGRRVINAGAVGMPYEGVAAAFWLLVAAEPELRRTDYDVAGAVELLRAGGCPDVDELILRESLLEPADPDEVATYFEGRATGGGSAS